MRELSKIADLFLFSFLFSLLESCQGTKALQVHSGDAQPAITPALRPVTAGRAPNFPHSPLPSSQHAFPSLIPKCSVRSSVTPAHSALRAGPGSVLSDQLSFRPSSPIKQTHTSLDARWHKIISYQNEGNTEQRSLLTLGHFMGNCLLHEYMHVLHLHHSGRLLISSNQKKVSQTG